MRISGGDLGLVGTAVCLVAAVGVLAMHTRSRHPGVAAHGGGHLSRADSLGIDSAYDAEQAASTSSYRPPGWIRDAQLARLRAVARREIAGDTAASNPDRAAAIAALVRSEGQG